MWSIVRILLSSLVSAGVHLYVWARLVRPMRPGRLRRGLGIAIAVLFVAVPVTTSARLWAPSLSAELGWPSQTWLAFVGLAAVLLLAIDLARLVARLVRAVARRPAPLPERAMSRRRFLAGTVATVAGASVARGVLEARGAHELVDVEVPLAKLPRALDGFTIVQLSDLHTGMTIDRAFVQRVVDRANALAPDLLALTGDLVDGPVEALADDVAPLAQLRARHGVFAVTGNHEYYAGVDAWIAAISRLGVRYLRNERVTIGEGAASFELAGVDDHDAARFPGHGEDLPAATAGRDPSRALVLLAHQPRQVRHAAKYGVDLQLSGHTHGGQIWPWHYVVRLQQGGLLAGRYEHEGTQLYVSRGCGYWGPPVRLFAPLEITRVILRAA
ncbi:MAG TPA: metallophosphoesterase [Kofleriaceae bacterium]|nr:metallophosphoesterase [Kofleriaceae bacterium]